MLNRGELDTLYADPGPLFEFLYNAHKI